MNANSTDVLSHFPLFINVLEILTLSLNVPINLQVAENQQELATLKQAKEQLEFEVNLHADNLLVYLHFSLVFNVI